MSPTKELEIPARDGTRPEPADITEMVVLLRNISSLLSRPPNAPAPAMRCGNCGHRIPMTGLAEADHAAAYKHKQICPKNTEAFIDRQQLLEEFAAQQLRDSQPPRPPSVWWKFWR